MNQFTMALSPGQLDQTCKALARCNGFSARYGLVLSQTQIAALARRRAEALRRTGRVEFGEGVLPRLARPVSEELGGVDYVNRWLEHLAVELRFVNAFPREQTSSILERSCPDWKGLLVNLFEPVAANALGRTLLGLSVPPLDFTEGERAALSAQLEQQSPAQLRQRFRKAGEALAEAHSLPPAYLADWAEGLAVRAAVVRDWGGLSGVFL